MNDTSMMVFSGNANLVLSDGIVKKLNLRLGMATVGRFSDGEIAVEIEENVRGKDVFIIQPTCSPTNENLMELLVMIDALKRASASRITAVLPYYGYARQDRRSRSARVPISAKLVARMIEQSGASRILTVDLHADQIQGFFDIPVDNVYSATGGVKKYPDKATDVIKEISSIRDGKTLEKWLQLNWMTLYFVDTNGVIIYEWLDEKFYPTYKNINSIRSDHVNEAVNHLQGFIEARSRRGAAFDAGISIFVVSNQPPDRILLEHVEISAIDH